MHFLQSHLPDTSGPLEKRGPPPLLPPTCLLSHQENLRDSKPSWKKYSERLWFFSFVNRFDKMEWEEPQTGCERDWLPFPDLLWILLSDLGRFLLVPQV